MKNQDQKHRAKTVAYDYDRQHWLKGTAAEELRDKQILEELEVLRGPRGEEFARFIGCNRTSSIKLLELEQKALRGLL